MSMSRGNHYCIRRKVKFLTGFMSRLVCAAKLQAALCTCMLGKGLRFKRGDRAACLDVDVFCYGRHLKRALQGQWGAQAHPGHLCVRVLVRLHGRRPIRAELRQRCRLYSKPVPSPPQVLQQERLPFLV